jgi:hypothetical protein
VELGPRAKFVVFCSVAIGTPTAGHAEDRSSSPSACGWCAARTVVPAATAPRSHARPATGACAVRRSTSGAICGSTSVPRWGPRPPYRAGGPQVRPRPLDIFFSTRFRPPPGRRMRVGEDAFDCANSCCPRRIVLRLRPLIWATKVIPPRPCWLAKKAATRRRLRSFNVFRRALIAPCRWATRLSGDCWQSVQEHR